MEKITLLSALELYFGHTFLVFLFGFTVLGIFAVPLVIAEFGFSAMFAITCILSVYGRKGILLALACLGVRMLVALPCVIWLGTHAWVLASSGNSSGGGKRAANGKSCSGYVLRFAVCCVLLLIGVVAERSVTHLVLDWFLKAV